VACTLDGFEGERIFAARLRYELRRDFARYKRRNAPVHTRTIWRQVIARACACKGIRSITDNRMRQLPLFEQGRAA
jgi:hypothetical protein